MTKVCTRCKKEKDESEFYKRKPRKDATFTIRNECKDCKKDYGKRRYIEHTDKIIKKAIEYYHKNRNNVLLQKKNRRENYRDELNAQHRKNRIKNKNEINKKEREYKSKHKNVINEQKRNNYLKNKDKIIIRVKEYQRKNRKKCNERNRIYNKRRRQTDVEFRFGLKIRRIIRKSLKNFKKLDKTWNMIGCTSQFFRDSLQQTAIKNGYIGFDINNFNGKEYHIDHIIPISAFNMKCSYHQKLCNHWSNLQILSAKENLEKGNKLPKDFEDDLNRYKKQLEITNKVLE